MNPYVFRLFLGLVVLLIIRAGILAFEKIIDKDIAAIVVTASVAFGCWLINAHQSQIRQQEQWKFAQEQLKRQHTFDVLLEIRLSDTFDRHYSCVYDRFLGRKGDDKYDHIYFQDKEKSRDYIIDPQNIEFRHSIMYLANFYEFLATAISHGYLEENVLKDAYRSRICDYFCRIEEYIKWARGPDKDSLTFKNLCRLYDEWKDVKASKEEA